MPTIIDDYLVQPWMAFEHGFRLGFDRPGDMRVRPCTPYPPEQRQRADHVANRAEKDYQDAVRRILRFAGDG